MRKRKVWLILFSVFIILVFASGWFLFSKYIRPNHYQLLRPYSIWSGRRLVTTESRIGKDENLQVFIPAGLAVLGKDSWQITTELPAYWISQIPVTTRDYKRFVMASGALEPRYRNEYKKYYDEKKYERLPVVFVSWQQAQDYCAWYGGHLPTEAQWEKAARGPDGIVLYWQDDEKAFEKANYDNFYHGKTFSGWLPKGATYYGLLDMSGNVREWVLDAFFSADQAVNSAGWQTILAIPAEGLPRMLKGGAYHDDLSHLRLNFRDAHDPNSPGVSRGFRCVFEE